MLKRHSFRNARAGVAAVEFAFIAPIVILVFFGLVELSQGMNCRQRMESVASTVADLVAQTTNITNNDRDNIFNAANAIMFPFPSTIQIKISSMVEDGANAGNGRVVWGDATPNTTARAVGEVVSGLEPGLITPGGSVIMAEVTYNYQSPSTYIVKPTVTMSSTFFSRPRRAVQVTRSAN